MNRAFQCVQVFSLLALAAAPAASQVTVKTSLNQSEYLEGEPVFVTVAFTNIGTEPLGYSSCDGHAELTITGIRPESPPNLRGCSAAGGFGPGSACGISHPPLMSPGQTVSFQYLLKGYHLPGGTYDLHASGRAGVRWFFGEGRNYSAVSQRKSGDPVEGASFEASLSLKIRAGTEEELRQRYLPYIRNSKDGLSISTHHAREAIAEMAPHFLEKTILGFLNQPEDAPLAVHGLSRISTAESRADLIGLFERSADLRLRALIVENLAAIGTLRELPFFVSLFPGYNSVLDDRIRVFAALGAGRIGGSAAVAALQSAIRSPSPEFRGAVAAALGNTRSAAVPVLMSLRDDVAIQNDVCWALATLTHHEWCEGGLAGTPNGWRNWWRAHGSRLTLYGMDECPSLRSLRPLVP